MASTSETGHTKNIAHFQSLISFCTGYGTAYNPVNNALKVVNMQAQLAAAQLEVQNVLLTGTTNQAAVNARSIAFQDFRKLATKVINALAVSGASAAIIADAKTINRKIQGKRATPLAPVPPSNGTTPPADPVSVSQQSYDKLIEHLSALITLLSQEPAYTPNEIPLKITALTTFKNDLIAKNTAVITTYTPANNQLISRNQKLYAPVTGLVDTALMAKNYIKSIFGASSPQYRQVSGLQFKTYPV